MERYFLRDENDTTITILAQCFASSYDEALRYFCNEGYVIGEVISEADWNKEVDLNGFEVDNC